MWPRVRRPASPVRSPRAWNGSALAPPFEAVGDVFAERRAVLEAVARAAADEPPRLALGMPPDREVRVGGHVVLAHARADHRRSREAREPVGRVGARVALALRVGEPLDRVRVDLGPVGVRRDLDAEALELAVAVEPAVVVAEARRAAPRRVGAEEEDVAARDPDLHLLREQRRQPGAARPDDHVCLRRRRRQHASRPRAAPRRRLPRRRAAASRAGRTARRRPARRAHPRDRRCAGWERGRRRLRARSTPRECPERRAARGCWLRSRPRCARTTPRRPAPRSACRCAPAARSRRPARPTRSACTTRPARGPCAADACRRPTPSGRSRAHTARPASRPSRGARASARSTRPKHRPRRWSRCSNQ